MDEEPLDFTDLGLVRRRDLGMSNASITRAIRSGRLMRPYPEIYVKASSPLDRAAAERRAALLYAGPGSSLSCVSACAEWGLELSDSGAVHLTSGKRRLRRTKRLFPHRRRHVEAVTKGDVPVSGLAASIVDAFGCLDRAAGREMLIGSLRERRVEVDRLREAAVPGIRARPAFLALLDDVAGGSHSEAELALIHLIRAAGLPEPARQLRVEIGGRAAYLDVAFESQRVAVEADSRRWHFSAEARAADIRRDAWLSAAGWVVLRFLYEQIVNESEWVGDRIQATLMARMPAP